MNQNRETSLGELMMRHEEYKFLKLRYACRNLVCSFFLIYTIYKIAVIEWNDDLTLLEKNLMMQVRIIGTAALILLIMESVNLSKRQSELHNELWIPYILSVACCIEIYCYMLFRA